MCLEAPAHSALGLFCFMQRVNQMGWCGEVETRRSAKPLCTGSIPVTTFYAMSMA